MKMYGIMEADRLIFSLRAPAAGSLYQRKGIETLLVEKGSKIDQLYHRDSQD
jgi:hypothetical protein